MSRSGRSRRLRLETAPGLRVPADPAQAPSASPRFNNCDRQGPLDEPAIDFSRTCNDGLEAACDGGLAISEGQRLRESYERLVGAEPPRARSHPARIN